MDPNDPSTWPASARAFYQRRRGAAPEAPLRALLAERIRRDGPLTFAQFMEAALYHPEHGYYTRTAGAVGPDGDFVTAPAHHPAFGRLVGRRVLQVARHLDAGEAFTVVEMGAGTGALAEGVLEALAEAGVPARCRFIEPFAPWRQRQEARLLPRWQGTVEWVPSLNACPPFTGVFLSNELPDAFPVHRIVNRGGVLRERWIDLDGDRLHETEGALSTPEIDAYFAMLGFLPQPDHLVEVSLALAPWVRQVCERLLRGSFLTLDYGATAEERYLHGPPQGTLRAYRDQAPEDPLAAPGLQDLTADVDFTTLLRTGEAEGLRLEAFTTQASFLQAMGWHGWLRDPEPGARRALADLIDPRLMGKTRVLELIRD
jgi:SAM-dependent MidA family methyltransferase